MEGQKEEWKRQKEEREQRKEEHKRIAKKESQQRAHVNKAFEKINRFDGSDPSYCFSWLEQIHSLVNEHPGRDFREELLFNCGGSVSKTIHATDPDVTPEQVKDAFYITTLISEQFHKGPVLTNLFNKNLVKLCRPITPGTHPTSSWPTQIWM